MESNFDKRQYFEEHIKYKVDDLKRELNKARIPFIFVASLHNDGGNTTNEVETNVKRKKKEEDFRDPDLYSDAITPGAMELELTDDRIKEIVKILNGFKAVPANNAADNYDDMASMKSVDEMLKGYMASPEDVADDEDDDDMEDYSYNDYDDEDGYIVPVINKKEQENKKDDEFMAEFLEYKAEQEENQKKAEEMGLTKPKFNIDDIGEFIIDDGNDNE